MRASFFRKSEIKPNVFRFDSNWVLPEVTEL